MSDLPTTIDIREEGPREGFQIERGVIPTARKIDLIHALAETGVTRIQCVSFVNPKAVPGMADADAVVAGLTPRPGVAYTGLWLNAKGFDRSLQSPILTPFGSILLSGSPAFLKRNQNRTPEQQEADQHAMLDLYGQHGVALEAGLIMAAFGCNFSGDVPVQRIVSLVDRLLAVAADHGTRPQLIALNDTMGWANPASVKRLVGAVRDRHPDAEILLHLHDTRGLAIANAAAGLAMGVRLFDAAVGGLGGCPFAGNAGAAGNIATEDLVFLCDEMGIDTGIDLQRMIACAELAEQIVGHPLPGAVKTGGALAPLRRAAAMA